MVWTTCAGQMERGKRCVDKQENDLAAVYAWWDCFYSWLDSQASAMTKQVDYIIIPFLSQWIGRGDFRRKYTVWWFVSFPAAYRISATCSGHSLHFQKRGCRKEDQSATWGWFPIMWYLNELFVAYNDSIIALVELLPYLLLEQSSKQHTKMQI